MCFFFSWQFLFSMFHFLMTLDLVPPSKHSSLSLPVSLPPSIQALHHPQTDGEKEPGLWRRCYAIRRWVFFKQKVNKLSLMLTLMNEARVKWKCLDTVRIWQRMQRLALEITSSPITVIYVSGSRTFLSDVAYGQMSSSTPTSTLLVIIQTWFALIKEVICSLLLNAAENNQTLTLGTW